MTNANYPTVYFLDLGGELGNEKHKARYYIGFVADGDVERRLAEHQSGRGARITAAAAERGFEIKLLLTVPGNRRDERRFKNRHNNFAVMMALARGTSKYPHLPTFYGAFGLDL